MSFRILLNAPTLSAAFLGIVMCQSRPMMIEAESVHSRVAEAEMPFLVPRDYEVASNWQDFVMNKAQVTGHPHQNDSEPHLAPMSRAHRVSQLA